MIRILEGATGHFKTASAVKLICEWLSMGATIGTNIPLKVDKVIEYELKRYGFKMDRAQIRILEQKEIQEFYKYVPGGRPELPSRVVLDECGRFWNAREWAKTGRQMLDFLALSRHECTDLWFIDQNSLNVDKQFRNLCEVYYRVFALKYMPLLGGLFEAIVPTGYMFQVFTRDRQKRMYWRLKVIDAGIFELYDSYNIVIDFGRERVGSRGERVGSGRINVVGLLGLLAMGYYFNRELKGVQGKIAALEKAPAVVVSTNFVQGLGGAVMSNVPVRICGYGNSSNKVVIARSDGVQVSAPISQKVKQ